MKYNGISFIVPIRGRMEMVPGFIQNIKDNFDNFEIIFCYQDDNLLFRKGQLSNLGYQYSTKDLVAFINVDYRFLSRVPIEKEMEINRVPLITFLYACRVREIKGRVVEEKCGPSRTPGGCQVFTREQFEKIGGHTNLILGWGIDDVVINIRVRQFYTAFHFLPYRMGHVIHDKFVEYPKREYVKGCNCRVAIHPPSDPEYDSFRETEADLVGMKRSGPNIFLLSFTNIRVSRDFRERERYNAQLRMEKDVLKL